LDRQYRAHYQAYFNIFHRCGLPVISVKSDVGMMGGKLAHEFMYLAPVGEDTLLICDQCGYSANRQIAEFQKTILPQGDLKPLEKVATPATKTIEELAEFLQVPKSKTAKAVFLIATIPEGKSSIDKFVFAIVRGDMELNETKLANAISALEMRPATEAEIIAVGAVPGYASPVGLEDVLVVIDDLIPASSNLVAGANEEGYHLKNVNYGRDYQADIITDITAAQEGDLCQNCSSPLKSVRGIEVGNIFKLGTRYSDSMGCTFLDKDGKEKPVIMGSYGIGSGRLLASVVEEYHDEHGLVLPVTISPYHVHLVMLPGKGDEGKVEEIANQIYQNLQEVGVEVLFDDRDESPGVKFNDADLIGNPIRLTVSQRSLEKNGAEYKRRDLQDRIIIPLDDVITRVKEEIILLETAIDKMVVETPFEE
jgi:prolyl-tRNA synthetase